MRYGVFSDVHSNLEALQACLERLESERVDGYLFCGDLVGYGPDPEACVQLVSALSNTVCVLGNHDAVLFRPEMEALFHEEALKVVHFNKQQLSPASMRFIKNLPPFHQAKNFSMVHGTPTDPIKEYFFSCAQFKSNYDLWGGSICFVGHTHLPFYIFGSQDVCSVEISRKEDLSISLSSSQRYVINPGSVGKPRDNNTHASFGIWDTDGKYFRFVRESYDFFKTQRKMKAAGLSDFLIDNLALGL